MPEEQFSSLKGKRIGVIGYGSQGRAHALNLRDSGLSPLIGVRPGRSLERAQSDGFETGSVEEVVTESDVVMLLIPDEAHREICRDKIIPNLSSDAKLGFAAGFSVHFRLVNLPEGCHFFLVAPKGPGELLRRRYVEGDGIPALVAASDAESMVTAKDYARAIGCGRAGIVETTFAEEAIADLFGEQCVLAGGLVELMKAAFKVLTDKGYRPEVAYIECIAEVEYMASLIAGIGLKHLGDHISSTAHFGGMTRGRRLIDEGVKRKMRTILDEIESGLFLKEFIMHLEQAGVTPDQEELEAIEKARRAFERGTGHEDT